MKNQRIVVALGRNAFGETFPEQQKNVKKAADAIADLAELKYEIVITHSNGPQVGMIQTAMTEFSRLDPRYTVAPMSLCGAMSQGYIGYDLQNAIRTELLNRGIFKPVSTIITQVRVDPFDKAFNHPTKVIGRCMSEEEAKAEEEKGNHVVSENGSWRRIIASPHPVDIYEIDGHQSTGRCRTDRDRRRWRRNSRDAAGHPAKRRQRSHRKRLYCRQTGGYA